MVDKKSIEARDLTMTQVPPSRRVCTHNIFILYTVYGIRVYGILYFIRIGEGVLCKKRLIGFRANDNDDIMVLHARVI